MSKARKVDIRRLREFAFTQLPKNSALRDILLAENREIDASTFLARVPIWLRLSRLKRDDTR